MFFGLSVCFSVAGAAGRAAACWLSSLFSFLFFRASYCSLGILLNAETVMGLLCHLMDPPSLAMSPEAEDCQVVQQPFLFWFFVWFYGERPAFTSTVCVAWRVFTPSSESNHTAVNEGVTLCP